MPLLELPPESSQEQHTPADGSGAASGRLSRLDAGPRALHVQTEMEGPESTRVVTVVVVDGRVRQRVTTEAPANSSRQRQEELISKQHDRVMVDLHRRLSAVGDGHQPAPEEGTCQQTRADVLSELHRRMKANDYRSAIDMLERAQKNHPDDWLWQTHLRIVRRKVQR